MRINKYIAQATGLSRRAADLAISQNKVTINGQPVSLGTNVHDGDEITLNGRLLKLPLPVVSILFNKPVGYVCSRNGQGSATIYELLPKEYHHLKSVGRLDKDSSGLLLLTNDGQLAYHLAHPGSQKQKRYQVTLDKPLQPADKTAISRGVRLEDGPSQLILKALDDTNQRWQVTMHEGRNRQIRRTFGQLGYEITALHRTSFGPYHLADLAEGQFRLIPKSK